MTKQQRNELKRIAGSPDASRRQKRRALIILLLGEGMKTKRIAKELRVEESRILKWQKRWEESHANAHISRILKESHPG